MVNQGCLNKRITVAKCCAATQAAAYTKALTYGYNEKSMSRKMRYLHGQIRVLDRYKADLSVAMDFNNEKSYKFDDTKIEVSEGKARLIGPTYPTDNPTITTCATYKPCELLSLVEDVSKSGSDDVRYTIEINGSQYWFDGSDWVVSSGYAETNTVQEILVNKDLLNLKTRVRLVAYLHSDDGSTTPEIEDITYKLGFCNCISEEQLSVVCEKITRLCSDCNC